MPTRNKRAPGERGAEGLHATNVRPDAVHHITLLRSCKRCGWSGDDRYVRIVEHWSGPAPGFWVIMPVCPRCNARLERR